MSKLDLANSVGHSLAKDVYKWFPPGSVVFKSEPPIDFFVNVVGEEAWINRWLRFWGKTAITIGEVVLVVQGHLSPGLLRHEATHVAQWRSKGLRFAWKYILNPKKYENPAEDAENV